MPFQNLPYQLPKLLEGVARGTIATETQVARLQGRAIALCQWALADPDYLARFQILAEILRYGICTMDAPYV